MKLFYTVEEVAEMLKLNKFTVYRLVETGKLKSKKFGKAVRIEDIDLQEYLDNSTNM